MIKRIASLLLKIVKVPRYILAIVAVLGIRLIRPFFLVRIEGLFSSRIGHFVGNTELYLCRRDAGINVPIQRHADFFYMERLISNQQLAIMWKRVLRIGPSWMLAPIVRINRLIPGGELHEIGQITEWGDIHNLLDQFPTHLHFTVEEEARGDAELSLMGLPIGAKFVCLNVRDSAFLAEQLPMYDWSYHSYRDCDIQNYVLAAEALSSRGYFVIRMGAKVHATIATSDPKVIDYATNGMRNDFMDIYLGAKCAFCITTGTGWDTVPQMFRKPIVYTNLLPLGEITTSRSVFLTISKKHVWKVSQKTLSLCEIFSYGVGYCSASIQYESKGVTLIENTPEEIRDVALEMEERIEGIWKSQPGDETLQSRFWEVFPTNAVDSQGRRYHGEIRSRFGAMYLRNNQVWLEK